MMAIMGTETGNAGLIQDFIRVQIEAVAACVAAIPHLAGPDERAAVVDLRCEHQRQLALLRELAREERIDPPVSGTAYEAGTIGGIRKAARAGGDRSVLEALARSEAAVVADYRRVVQNTVLSVTTRPVFERALDALRRHRRQLVRHARLAL